MQKFIIALSFVCHITSFAMDSSKKPPPDPMQELCLAIHRFRIKDVERLIKAHPLLIHTYHKHTEQDTMCVLYTLSYQCRYYSAINDRVQPLHMAVASGNKDCVKLLLKRKADPNAKTISGLYLDSTPLHFATDPNIIPLLLQKGAKVDAKNADGWTALYQALFYPHRDPNFVIAKKLILCGANIHQKIDGQTLFKIAESKQAKGHPLGGEIVKFLFRVNKVGNIFFL